jgi:hypothetical protein
MKWDRKRPAKAAVERCQVRTRQPPHRALGSLFLIYPPTRAQWGARPGGLWGGFPSPAKLICMGFARNRLASSHATHIARRNRPRRRPEPANAAPGSEPAQHVQCGAASCPAACLACSFLIYPPTRAQWAARPGGLWGGFPSPAKLICMGFARNRLASSHTAKMAGRAPAAWPNSRTPAEGPRHHPGGARGPPSRPTLYPNRPTLHPAPQVAYPIPQPAYPIPPLPRHHPPGTRLLIWPLTLLVHGLYSTFISLLYFLEVIYLFL